MKKITLTSLLAFLCVLQVSAQLSGSGYYRMRNSYYDSHYLSFANHYFNYTKIVGSVSSAASDNGAAALGRAGTYLKTDIHLVDDKNCINPSTIIYLKSRTQSSSNKEYDIQAQGTSLIALATGIHAGTNQELKFTNRYATINSISGNGVDTKYSASMELKSDTYIFLYGYPNLGTFYFLDNNGTFAISKDNPVDNALWFIEPVNSFNVNATIPYGGKYYATMYTAFAYILDGEVESAYVVSNADLTNNKVYLNKIASTGEIVPAGTPVLLECKSNIPSDNRLKPTEAPLVCSTTPNEESAPEPSTVTNYSETNYLAGTYYCNTDNNTYNNPKSVTENDQTTMRVLNINSQGKLGFFKLSTSVKYMAANKAWLDLSALPASARNLSKFSIVFNGIDDNDNEDDPVVSEDGGFPDSIEAIQNGDSHTIVFDLQGRRVSAENLMKGIYIVNGKKVFIQ